MNDKVAVLASLARALTRQSLEAPLAHRLGCAACVVVGADGAAITLSYTRDERITLCATTDLAARIEDLQEVLGQGPGSLAYDSGQQVRTGFGLALSGPATHAHESGDHGTGLERDCVTPSTGEQQGWPELDQLVADDFGSVRVLAVPIRPDHEVVGVLTFYAKPRPVDQLGHPGADRAVDSEVAQFLADAVGVALLHDAQWHVNENAGPWASRSQVHQATGMVIAQLHVPSDDALALLRAHAFSQGLTLIEVSTAVLRREIDFSPAAWTEHAGDQRPDAPVDPPATEDPGSTGPSADSDGSTTV